MDYQKKEKPYLQIMFAKAAIPFYYLLHIKKVNVCFVITETSVFSTKEHKHLPFRQI